MSAINIGLSGATMAMQRFDRSATATVQDASRVNDLVSDFVEQIDARTAFAASISVIKTADQMTGRLLDLKA
jgi:flagellar hook protein FlgE